MTDDADGRRFFSKDAAWCSSLTRWPSIHLRRYRHERVMEEIETLPAQDQVVVLVTEGATLIESFRAGRWRSAAHVPGCVGMTAPGERARLRWRGSEHHETVHLHLPAPVMAAALDEARDGTSSPSYPTGLSRRDGLVEAVMLALMRGADEGVPDLYAASAAQFLAQHLVAPYVRRGRDEPSSGEDGPLRRVEAYMNAHLSAEITLHELAAVAGCSPFRLIRLCRAHWGQTPFQRLTQLRMDAGRHLLRTTKASVIAIALECGYANPSHFATAFRRVVGVSPSAYRKL